MYTFTLHHKIKPYVRMTQKGQWVDPQALEYKDSQCAIALEFRAYMSQMNWDILPARTPLKVFLTIEMPNHVHGQDGDNQLKAILDAAQGVVFPDDRWIDEYHVYRYQGSEHRILVELGVLDA